MQTVDTRSTDEFRMFALETVVYIELREEQDVHRLVLGEFAEELARTKSCVPFSLAWAPIYSLLGSEGTLYCDQRHKDD